MADAEFWHKVADERAAEITRLRSDNQKLREALDEAAIELEYFCDATNAGNGPRPSTFGVAIRARAALAEGNSNG